MTAGRGNVGLRKRHALQLFKTDMCKFFLQNRCENGDKCSYAHNIEEVRRKPDLTRTSMCKGMLQNGVCNSPGCRFAHTEVELRATHGFFKMKMCSFAQSGRCKHGNACRFAHSSEELRPMRPPDIAADGTLLDRQPQSPPPPPPAATTRRGHATRRTEEFTMNNFIFGAIQMDEQTPSTPEQQQQVAQMVDEQCLQWRGATAAGGKQLQAPRSGSRAGKASSSQSAVGTGVPDTGQGTWSSWNESDSADASSWASGSSATEVPRSEHTGSPPPTTSDSSGGAGAGNGGAPNAAKPRAKAKERRQPPRDAGHPSSEPEVSTLIIMNTPLYLTQGALLSMFEDLTYEMRGSYDFFYCPWDVRLGQNLGYALVNFVKPEDAAAFQLTWSNKDLCHSGRGQKALRVMKAPVQGLQANLEFFSRVEITPCTDQRFRPLMRDARGILQPLELASDGAPQQQPEAPLCAGGGPPAPPLPELPPTHLMAQPLVPPRRRNHGGQPPQDARRWGQQEAPARWPGACLALGHQARPRRGQQSAEFQGPAEQEALDMGGHGAPGEHMGDFSMRMEQGGLGVGCSGGAQQTWMGGHKDFWQKAPGAADEVDSSMQQLVWPVMMTAVPWPMGDQAHKALPVQGKGFQCMQEGLVFSDGCESLGGAGASASANCMAGNGQIQEMLMVNGVDAVANIGASHVDAGGNGVSNNSMQVPYQQLVPCMMMPMNTMTQAEGTRMEQSPMANVPAGNMQMLPPMAMAGLWPSADEVYAD